MSKYVRERVCVDCGKVETIRKDNQATRCKNCSAKIGNKAVQETRTKNRGWRKCKECGQEFFAPKSSKKVNCSKECLQKSREKKRLKRVCKHCGKAFEIYASALNTNASGNYCSRQCYYEHMATVTGKQNKSYNRVEVECAECGKPLAVIPSRISAYKNSFCGEECKWKHHHNYISGEKNCNWRGGHDKYRGDFETVKKQWFDGVQLCAICGTAKHIHIHHIIPYRLTQDNSRSNLIPLCRKHHKKIESLMLPAIEGGTDLETSKAIINCILRERQMAVFTIASRLMRHADAER